MLNHRVAQGIAECERALEIDRNFASAHVFMGMGKFLLGRNDETEGHVREALRISPRDTLAGVWSYIAGWAKLASARDVEAVDWLNRSIELAPNSTMAHFLLGSALAHLGRVEEAREATRVGLQLDPGFTIARFRGSSPFSDQPVYLAGREHIYDGMRIAGVPEN